MYQKRELNNQSMTPTELPEGPKGKLTDEYGKQWDLTKAHIAGLNHGETHQMYHVTPHIERKPLFTDKAGFTVFEGDVVYFYNKRSETIESIITNEYDTVNGNPSFQNYEDCKKWVASNIKTMTKEEALRLFQKNIWEMGAFFTTKEAWVAHIENEIKEQCFTPKQ
jgi:hypothetical protein